MNYFIGYEIFGAVCVWALMVFIALLILDKIWK